MKIIFERDEEKKEERYNLMGLIFTSILGTIVGVLIVFLSGDGKIGQLSGTIGQLIVSISMGSLLLEWFGYVKYTQKRLAEILCKDEVLDVITDKRKRELKTAILNNLYMPDKDLGDNNIVSVIDNELDNILKDYYYNEYIMYVDISLMEEEGRKLIKKRIRRTFSAETINNQKCTLGAILSAEINPVRGENTLELNSLKINGEKYKVPIEKQDNTEDSSNHYDERFYADISTIKDKLVFEDKINIDMEYTTYTDINDTIYSHQINRPCKHYCIHFNYTSEIDLDLVGFGFMSNFGENKKRLVKTSSGHMLRFLSWILPGDGVMAALTIKNK